MINKWKQTSISQFCKIVSGSTPRTSEPSYWNGEIGWVTPNDLSKLTGKYIESGERSITELGLESCSADLLPANSLIMSSRAPIGYFAINKNPMATNQGCKSFVCDDSINIEFFYYTLNQYVNSIKRLGSGSTFAEVNKKQLEKLSFPIPSKEVQQKISNILSIVDDNIQKTDQIIQKTEKLKQGLADELLNSKSKNWKSFSLKELCNFTTGKLNSNQAVDNGKYPFFTCAKETFSIDRYSFDTKAVLLAGNNAAGIYSVKYYHGKFDAYQRTYVITVKDESVLDYHFLKELLNIRLNLLKDFSVGTNTKFLTLKLLLSLEVSLPPIDVQKQIVEILSTLDKKIDAENLNRDRLKLLKAGLMSDIFGQKVQIN